MGVGMSLANAEAIRGVTMLKGWVLSSLSVESKLAISHADGAVDIALANAEATRGVTVLLGWVLSSPSPVASSHVDGTGAMSPSFISHADGAGGWIPP